MAQKKIITVFDKLEDAQESIKKLREKIEENEEKISDLNIYARKFITDAYIYIGRNSRQQTIESFFKQYNGKQLTKMFNSFIDREIERLQAENQSFEAFIYNIKLQFE